VSSLSCTYSPITGFICHSSFRGSVQPEDKFDYYSTALRLCFKYSNGLWERTKSVKDIPLKYYLLFDMNKIGEFSIEPKSLYGMFGSWNTPYLSGLYIVKSKIQPIGKKNKNFSSTWMGIKKYRPIVSSSVDNNFKDPKQWKPTEKLPADIIEKCKSLTIEYFKKEIPKSRTPDFVPKGKVNFVIAFISNNNEYLINTKYELINYQQLIYDNNLISKWFYASDIENIKYIGSYKTLIDAADYDLDGTSDIIFYDTKYVAEGYVLLYKNLDKKCEFWWDYH
jgi:hypothetical protein